MICTCSEINNIISFLLLPNIRNFWAVGMALSAQTTQLSRPARPQWVSAYNKKRNFWILVMTLGAQPTKFSKPVSPQGCQLIIRKNV